MAYFEDEFLKDQKRAKYKSDNAPNRLYNVYPLSWNFSIGGYAHVQFYKRYLDFSTKTSNLQVNHLLTVVTFS